MSFKKKIAATFNLMGLRSPLSLERELFLAVVNDDAREIAEIARLDPEVLTLLPDPVRQLPQTPAAKFMAQALDYNKHAAAKALSTLSPGILTATGPDGVTFPMFYAKHAGSAMGLAGMASLLNAEILAASDNAGNKLLHYAAMGVTGSSAIETLFPFTGSDANAPNKKGETPLMLAAAYGTPDDLSMLMTGNAALDATDMQGNNATMYAIRHSNLANAIYLMDLGGTVNFSDPAVETQLRVASYEGNFEFVQVVGRRRQLQEIEAAEAARRAEEAALQQQAADKKDQERLVGEVVATVKQGARAMIAPATATFMKRPGGS